MYNFFARDRNPASISSSTSNLIVLLIVIYYQGNLTKVMNKLYLS